MYIGEIKTADIANGPGMRVSVFVSGCRRHCKGCFQPETWDFWYGRYFDREHENLVINQLSRPYHEGLSILGGEPLDPRNLDGVLRLIKSAKDHQPLKSIWLYTGYTYEELIEKVDDRVAEILDLIDVLVDGPFAEEQKRLGLRFRGSSNQRVIDVPASIVNGELTLLDI